MEKTYKILKLVLLLLVFAALILGANLLYRNLSTQVERESLVAVTDPAETLPADETEPQVQSAPDFTFYDRDGNAHKLSDFRGKPVILNFWASWCGPCKSEMPDFEKMYLRYGDEIHFLMVNLTDGQQETVDSASSFVAAQGYTFPVYYDSAVEGAIAYGVSAVPVTYFLDEAGSFVAWGQGALSEQSLQSGIDMLLNQ